MNLRGQPASQLALKGIGEGVAGRHEYAPSAALQIDRHFSRYLPPGIAGWRYSTFSDTTIYSGWSGYLDIPLEDGITNLQRYALGFGIYDNNYSPIVITPSNLPHVQKQLIGGVPYLTLTFIHNKRASDITIAAEVADEPNGPWTSIDPLVPANQVSIADNTPGANQETIVVKDKQALNTSTKRFMRLRVTNP